MKQYFPIDVALDDDLFYSYRISMGIFDSLIFKDEEEKIKNVFQSKKSSKNNDIDLYKQEFLKKLNSNENGIASEVFTETNNYLSCIGKLNNEFIHFLFQFSEIITSAKTSSKLMFVGNDSILYNSGTDENFECRVLPIDSSIIGFVDYIDTRNDTMKSFVSKFNKKISEPSPFLDNKYKSNKNDFITYIKLLLRVSFIKSICLLKMYGKRFPIYLFDGCQLLVKIEPIFNSSNDNCFISYKVINDQTDSSTMITDLNYHQFEWYRSWKKIFKITNSCFLFQNDYPSQFSPNKKLCIQDNNPEFSLTPPRKVIPIINDEQSKDNSHNEKQSKKISSFSKHQETQKDIFSEEENNGSLKPNDESSTISPSLSKTTNDVINELLNKPNSNMIPSKQKKKRSKSESSDIENSQDYVDKLIQQQTMQLFDL